MYPEAAAVEVLLSSEASPPSPSSLTSMAASWLGLDGSAQAAALASLTSAMSLASVRLS